MSSDKVHVMVDIETWDTKPSAVILSLGACVVTNTDVTFYKEAAVDSQASRTASIATMDWWAEQEKNGVYYPNKGTQSLKEVLQEFSRWLSTLRAEPIIWCKGTDFDTAILAHAYNQCSLQLPWKYNNVRDFRTLLKLHSQLERGTNLVPHHALQDAIYQSRELQRILNYNNYLQLG